MKIWIFSISSPFFQSFPHIFLILLCFWYFIGSEPVAKKYLSGLAQTLGPGALRTLGTKTSTAIPRSGRMKRSYIDKKMHNAQGNSTLHHTSLHLNSVNASPNCKKIDFGKYSKKLPNPWWINVLKLLHQPL